MENKHVGYILLGVSVLVVLNIFTFQSMITDTGGNFCTQESCPYHSSFNNLLYISYGIAGLLIVVGLVLIFSKPNEKIVIKKVKTSIPKRKSDTSGLRAEDKKVLALVKESKAIFQADLIEKTGFGKAKMTRIIDRLEGKEIVERKRRGMTNVVVLKE